MSHKFDITILGVNSALPVHGRHPSAQIVNYNERFFLIDCGEGTQMQIQHYKIRKSKIDHIFISHLHGDHCFGLPGLLTSYALGGRGSKLTLHGPMGIKDFVDSFVRLSGSHLDYPLEIIEYQFDKPTEISIYSNLKVHTFPLKHRIATIGYRFQEIITEKNIVSEKIKELDLSIDEIKSIKNGGVINRGGQIIPNEVLTHADAVPRSYAYCSDTIYDEDIIPYIEESTLLYHETTYLDDLEHLADQRFHTTLGGAIKIAKRANVDRLITGHYSSRYADISIFEQEGKKSFDGLLLGEEGRVYTV